MLKSTAKSQNSYFGQLLGGVMLLGGGGAILLFSSAHGTGWKAISLFFAAVFILEGALRTVVFPLTALPEGHCGRFVSSVAYLAAGLYYAVLGRSILLVGLSWWFMLLGVLGLLSALQGIVVEGKMVRTLLKAYENKRPADLGVPFLFVLAEPGMGVWFSHRLVSQTCCALAEHRYFPAHSDLYLPGFDKRRASSLWKYRYRIVIGFVISESVRRYSMEFRNWLVSQSAAFIVVRTPLGASELYEKSFNERAEHGYRVCRGPTFAIHLRSPIGDTSFPASIADQTLECVHSPRDRHLSTIIAPLVNRLASTAFPVAASDSRLSKENRSLIGEIASSALAPLACSYLRFRLSESNVERFLGLLEGIECMVKCSAFAMLAERWAHVGADVSNKQLLAASLTLGFWVRLLQELCAGAVTPGRLDHELCDYWSSHVSQIQTCLIEKVREGGFPLSGADKLSRLDWLEWFRDLRNITRGHGIVTAESIASLWHPLHEVFLEMMSDLRFFTLSCELGETTQNCDWVPIKGWLKPGAAYSTPFTTFDERNARATLRVPPNRQISLHPLIIIHGNRVLLWDCLRKNEEAIEFLDYTSGSRQRLPCSAFCHKDPYQAWLLMSQQDKIKSLISEEP